MTSVFKLLFLSVLFATSIAESKYNEIKVFKDDMENINQALTNGDINFCDRIDGEDSSTKRIRQSCKLKVLLSLKSIDKCSHVKGGDLPQWLYFQCIVGISVINMTDLCKGKFSNTMHEKKCSEMFRQKKVSSFNFAADSRLRSEKIARENMPCEAGEKQRDKWCYKQKKYEPKDCDKVSNRAIRDFCYLSIGYCEHIESSEYFAQCVREPMRDSIDRYSANKLIEFCNLSGRGGRYDFHQCVSKKLKEKAKSSPLDVLKAAKKFKWKNKYEKDGILRTIVKHSSANVLVKEEACSLISNISSFDLCKNSAVSPKSRDKQPEIKKFDSLLVGGLIKDKNVLKDLDIQYFSKHKKYRNLDRGILTIESYGKAGKIGISVKIGGSLSGVIMFTEVIPYVKERDHALKFIFPDESTKTFLISQMIINSLIKKIPPEALKNSQELADDLGKVVELLKSDTPKSIKKALRIIDGPVDQYLKQWPDNFKAKVLNYMNKNEFVRQLHHAADQLRN